jgi:hypothetical protein
VTDDDEDESPPPPCRSELLRWQNERKHEYTLQDDISNLIMKHFVNVLESQRRSNAYRVIMMQGLRAVEPRLPRSEREVIQQAYAPGSTVQVVYVPTLLRTLASIDHWILIVLFPRKGKLAASVNEIPEAYGEMTTFLRLVSNETNDSLGEWTTYAVRGTYDRTESFAVITCDHAPDRHSARARARGLQVLHLMLALIDTTAAGEAAWTEDDRPMPTATACARMQMDPPRQRVLQDRQNRMRTTSALTRKRASHLQ